MERTRYFLPRELLSILTVESDLFALCSAIYYTMTGRDLHNNLVDGSISKNIE